MIIHIDRVLLTYQFFTHYSETNTSQRRPIVNENNAAVILAFAALNHMQAAGKWKKREELVSDMY